MVRTAPLRRIFTVGSLSTSLFPPVPAFSCVAGLPAFPCLAHFVIVGSSWLSYLSSASRTSQW